MRSERMAEDLIRYDILAQDALRGVLRKVLSEVAKTGLPGEHHFYITFATKSPGVRISSRLVNQYPVDMTIILQHQFWDLSVSEHALEVGLSFNGIPERLLIPFTAVKAFVDPSVQFTLQFDPSTVGAEIVDFDENETAVGDDAKPAKVVPGPKVAETRPEPKLAATSESKATSDDDDDGAEAEVFNLDAFRKKN
jgi:hypothetical protein